MSILEQSNARACLNCLGRVPPYLHGVGVWMGLSWGTGGGREGTGHAPQCSAVLYSATAEPLAVVCVSRTRERWQAVFSDPHTGTGGSGSSWAMVAAWLTLCELSLSTQQCSEPLIMMGCFSWGEIGVSWNHISAFHTPHSSTHLYLLNKVSGLFSRFLQPLSESTICLCGWPLLFCHCHKLLN